MAGFNFNDLPPLPGERKPAQPQTQTRTSGAAFADLPALPTPTPVSTPAPASTGGGSSNDLPQVTEAPKPETAVESPGLAAPLPTMPASLTTTRPSPSPNDGHKAGTLAGAAVAPNGVSPQAEDADAQMRRDLWKYGMQLSMHRAYEIDRENRAEARKVQSGGWQFTGGRVNYNIKNYGSYTPPQTSFLDMLKPFDDGSANRYASTYIGHGELLPHGLGSDWGRYLQSTEQNMKKMYPGKSWDDLTAAEKDRVTNAPEGSTHKSVKEIMDERRGLPALVTRVGPGDTFIRPGKVEGAFVDEAGKYNGPGEGGVSITPSVLTGEERRRYGRR